MGEQTGGRKPVHLGLTLTGAAVLFLGLRLLAVSHYDWHTAFAVADTVGVDDAATVVVGTLMADPWFTAAVVLVLAPAAIAGQIRMGRPRRDNAGHAAYLIALLAFGFSLTATFRMWWLPLGVAAGAGILAGLLRLPKGEWGAKTAHWIVKRTWAALAVALLVMAATVRSPWVPLERIDTEDGTVYGYVLETPSGFLKVLRDDDQRLVTLIASTVTDREEVD